MQRAGVEANGLLLNAAVFAGGLTPPPTYRATLEPQDAALDPSSNAIDRAMILPNVNDRFTGAAPDLGAQETGCPAPIYGPRPPGIDESNQPPGCEPPAESSLGMVKIQP